MRAGGRRGLRPHAGVADEALPGRDRHVHRRQLRLPARPAGPRPRPARGARRVRPARAEGGEPAARRAPAPDLLVPGALRRGAARDGARRVRRDRLHGHRRQACSSRAAGCGRSGRLWPTRPPPPAPRSTTAAPSPAWSAAAGASPRSGTTGTEANRATPSDRLACDAVVLTPDLPVVHRLIGFGPRGGRCRCGTRRAPSCCTRGSAARGPRSPTTRSRSVRPGTPRSARSSTTAG